MARTQEQRDIQTRLLIFFTKCKYPSKSQKEALATELKKPVKTIHNWFNRQRCEEKKRDGTNRRRHIFQNQEPNNSQMAAIINAQLKANLYQKLKEKIILRQKIQGIIPCGNIFLC